MKPEKEPEHRDPFRVPEGYFENLSERIMGAVLDKSGAEEDLPAVKPGKWWIRPYISLAAIITGLAIIFIALSKAVSKQGDGLTQGSKTSAFITEVITEEIDIYTIETELMKLEANRKPPSVPEDDYEGLLIENIDETDLIDLL